MNTTIPNNNEIKDFFVNTLKCDENDPDIIRWVNNLKNKKINTLNVLFAATSSAAGCQMISECIDNPAIVQTIIGEAARNKQAPQQGNLILCFFFFFF